MIINDYEIKFIGENKEGFISLLTNKLGQDSVNNLNRQGLIILEDYTWKITDQGERVYKEHYKKPGIFDTIKKLLGSILCEKS